MRQRLEAIGVPAHKIIGCYPVMNYARFHDASPVGEAILNLGACRPKKKFEDFIDLARSMPDKQFNLISIGYLTEKILHYNIEKGGPVNFCTVVQPEEMPGSLQEAWVAGLHRVPRAAGRGLAHRRRRGSSIAHLGVCMPRIRPDLDEYIGEPVRLSVQFDHRTARHPVQAISRRNAPARVPAGEEIRYCRTQETAYGPVGHLQIKGTGTFMWTAQCRPHKRACPLYSPPVAGRRSGPEWFRTGRR